MIKRPALSGAFVFFSIFACAQDIETMLNAPILNTSGGISVNNISTFVPGDSAATNPFALFLSGNLNFSLFGTVNVPLSFAFTNQQLSKSVSLPFNRFSLSPSYKWVKVYAGYTSMSFSPYTLAGHELFGGGVELSPDNGFKVSALFGRLKKSAAGEEGIDPAYRRLGGGLKAEYQKDKYTVGINLFKAQDLKSTLPLADPDSLPVLPQDNLTGGINFSLNMIKNLRFSAEYGFSALNRNIYRQQDGFRPIHTKGDLAIYHAAKTQVAFTRQIGTIGATYEYVAPGYATLGAYYMTNDFENITANIAAVIKKFNLSFDAGYQRNNLDRQKNGTTSRFIYSGNFAGNLTEKLNVALNFSNLQSYLYINDVYSQVTQTTQFQNLDTLNVTQLNYTASLNAGYTLANSKEQRQSINTNLMYQRSAEAQQYSRFSGNDIYNAALAYQFSLLPVQLDLSASVNYNYGKMPEDMFTRAMTYSLTAGKTFFNVLKTAFSATYSDMDNETGGLSEVLNLRLSGGYILAKKHGFNVAATYLNTKTPEKTRLQYVINLSYAYSFGVQLSRKDKKLKMDGDF
jgi:hypothetical protein